MWTFHTPGGRIKRPSKNKNSLQINKYNWFISYSLEFGTIKRNC